MRIKTICENSLGMQVFNALLNVIVNQREQETGQ